MVRALVLWLAVLSLSGCMLTPTDEMAVCGRNAAVQFTGYTLVAGQTVELQAASSATGTFTTFATATASGSAVNVNGTQLYAWSVRAIVPTWVYRASGYDAFVRGKVGDNFLVTFDTVNAGGQTQYQCIGEQLGQGKSGAEAGWNCRSADTPVVRLRAPLTSTCPCPTTVSGNVTISDAVSAAYYQCMTTLNGNLSVTPAAPSTVALPALTEVHGDVTLDYTTPGGTARAIQLANLPNIDGDLTLRGTFSSGTVDLGLNEVDWVYGTVTLDLENTSANALTVAGLEDLSAVPYPHSTRLLSSGAFYPDYDFLRRFESTDTVRVESTDLDPSKGLPLSAPWLKLAISLEVVYPPELPPTANQYGFGGARHVFPRLENASYIRIVNDPFYPSSWYGTFARNYPKLTTVGMMVLEGTQLTGLDIGDAAITLQTLTLRDNPALRTLARPGLTFGGSSALTIVDNPALKQCTAQAFAAAHPGSTVSGNNPTPCACAPSPHVGDLLIDDPVEATTHSCVSSVSGTLTIGDHVRMDRVTLPALTSIGNHADLLYTMGDYTRHGDRRVIELPALTSVGGDLLIEAYYSEAASPAFDVGMNALTSVGGDIDFYARNGGFSGLAGLTSHAGDIHLHGPYLDVQGSMLMPNLAHVGGTLRCEGFFQFTTFFQGLVDVGGDLEFIAVRKNGGFSLLTEVGGDLVLDPTSFSPLPLLADVGGSVVLDSTGFGASLDVSSVPTDVHGLLVTNNPGLSVLDSGLRVVGSGPITIQNNPALPTCAANNYVAAQTASGWTGTALVSGNGAGGCP
jgi:hypothetical protein